VGSDAREGNRTVTQQKALKRRVRARMAKTGERYTAARRVVLAKTSDELEGPPPATAVPERARGSSEAALDPSLWTTSDEAMQKATGRTHAEWFALLDAWGGTGHSHTETAAWLAAAHGAPGWWRQAITVAYQRTRGMRRVHEMAKGFTVSVTRTIAVPAEVALDACTDPAKLRAWFPDAPMELRQTRARMTARFEWSEPPSRVSILSWAKDPGRTVVTVSHERIPDAKAAARLKAEWRDRLGDLKAYLEG
jgi:hypothetical protein